MILVDMEYKKLYTPEEVEEICQWFEQRRDQLPAALKLHEATSMQNLPDTVEKYLAVARLHQNNSTYSAQIYFLGRVQDRLLKAGLLKNE